MTITYINEGAIHPNKLIFFIEEFYKNESKFKIEHRICVVENNKGEWRILFRGTPEKNLVLSILFIFQNRLYFDNLHEMMFNYELPIEVSFFNLAGNCGLNNLSKIFSYYEHN